MHPTRARQVLELASIKAKRQRKAPWEFFAEIMSWGERRQLRKFQRQHGYGDTLEALAALANGTGFRSASTLAYRVAHLYVYGGPPHICYEGPVISSEGTSIKGSGAAPAIREMMGSEFQKGMKVLDYGAGKFARNADFLRDQGLEVYAYDPYNGTDDDGWKKGNVSSKKPSGGKFDVAFTSFVLNVVRCSDEKKIIQDCRKFGKSSFHICRGTELIDSIRDAVRDKRNPVWTFFQEEFAPKYPPAQQELNKDYITDGTITMFAEFGVQTTRGFQRLPRIGGGTGLNLIKKNERFSVYAG